MKCKKYSVFHFSALKNLWLLLFLVITSPLLGQVDYVIIDSIIIVGNHKTKKNVIMQEIDLHSGDTLSLENIADRLLINEKRISSIGLFNLSTINIKNWNTELSTCNIEIKVQENWYIYPYVIFELADRNFNVWGKEFNYSFKRVNYGLALDHINLTGNKDKLKLKYQTGYIKKIELAYIYPYLWGNTGLFGNVLYSENREISYRTIGNKPAFYSRADNDKIVFQHRAHIGISHRSNPQLNQTIKLEYVNLKIDSSVSNKNADFFGENRTRLQYFLLDYELKYDNTVYPLYPQKGYRLELKVRKEGLGIFNDLNNLNFSIALEQYTSIFKNVILANRLKFKINVLPDVIPYYLNNGIGYGNDYITGYQLYVLDGRNFMLAQNSIRWKIMDHNFNLPKFMPKQFKVMNAQVYFRFNIDGGFSNDPLSGTENPLSNQIQLGYGPSLDFIMFNNVSFSVNYGFTQRGDRGIFFDGGFNF
jgi:outer membrane protein assembly factor BamA